MKLIQLIIVILLLASCQNKQASESIRNERWWTEADRSLILAELLRTTNELKDEIEFLSAEQWNFHETPNRWSIAEIVEHLEMQNQLHYREITVVSNAPQYLQFRSITEGMDSYFSDYGTDTTRGKAQWFLEPLGRFGTKAKCENAFYKVRGKLTQFVKETPIDLRKQFTFRTPVEGKDVATIKISQVRDLHQLLLTGIGHTDRHLTQIRKIKEDSNWPN